MRCAAGDHLAATSELIQALELFRSLGDHQGEANTLCYLGRVQHEAGDYPAATASLTQALATSCEFGDRQAQAEALTYLGRLYLTSADPDQALVTFRDALRVGDELQNPLHQARALDDIGRCLTRSGNTGAAADHLSRALALYQRLRVPEATEVTQALTSLRTDQVPKQLPPRTATDSVYGAGDICKSGSRGRQPAKSTTMPSCAYAGQQPGTTPRWRSQ